MSSAPKTPRQPCRHHAYGKCASPLTEKLLLIREVRRADDGRGHTGLREDPRERDLRHLHALPLRELFYAGTQRGGGQKARPGHAWRYAPVDDLQVSLGLVPG